MNQKSNSVWDLSCCWRIPSCEKLIRISTSNLYFGGKLLKVNVPFVRRVNNLGSCALFSLLWSLCGCNLLSIFLEMNCAHRWNLLTGISKNNLLLHLFACNNVSIAVG
ncbi:unnamed protein product [Trifolium pratense]|uniref:Uncharacterized protein n=1 Tax=Trifolium pratense TaxID=57577 RepID=A0ACB0IS73_TRIPR|nr:unnamed protein product [Trifolium pratense]